MSDMQLDFDVSQLEPQEPPKKAPKAAPKKEVGKKKKVNGVFISWIIALIIFVIGIIICSINYGDYDKLITNAFDNPDPPIPFLEKLGEFINPSPGFGWFEEVFDSDGDIQNWLDTTWQNGNIGQIFSEVLIVVFVLLFFSAMAVRGKERKKAAKVFMEANPEWTKAFTEIKNKKEKSKEDKKKQNALKKEMKSKREVKTPALLKMWKYIVFFILVAIITLIITRLIFKEFWGRFRPNNIVDPDDFTPFWLYNGGTGKESFFSGHTSQAAILITFPLMFLGSKKKVIAYLLAGVGVFYVVITGIGRMASGHHWFSDVLFGGFVTFTTTVICYFLILSVPYQEKTMRYKLIRGPFNRGYKMILEGKSLIKDDADAAFQKINKGLEYLAESKVELEKAGSKGREDFGTLGLRIDDLSERFKILIQEYFGMSDKSGEALETYMVKWSYVF